MTTAAIRERLCNYINAVDDKKIEAIYTLLENEIKSDSEWWNDETLLEKLNKEYTNWENGSEKGFTVAEVESSLQYLRNKRQVK